MEMTAVPKKPTTTKEAMTEGAFRLVREKGQEFLTARNLAAFLGCSTQPVMYQFPGMDQRREQTYRRVDEFHSEYLLAAGDLLGIGLRYIRFAEEEPHLFRFLFQSGRFSGLRMEELFQAPELSGILDAVCTEEEMAPEEAAAFFEPLAALVHGYASLIANNAMKYDPDAVANVLTAIAEGLERKKS